MNRSKQSFSFDGSFGLSKGFGFITSQTGDDIFVHHSGIVGEGYRTLTEGETVEFQIAESPRGPKGHQCSQSRVRDRHPTSGESREETSDI